MKRLVFLALLATALLFTGATFSQTQFRKIYTSAYTEESGTLQVTNTFLYNYGNTTDLKIHFSNDQSEIFEQVTEYSRGNTVSGFGYISCMYHGTTSDIRMLLQIFDDTHYGIRVTLTDGSSIQFYE